MRLVPVPGRRVPRLLRSACRPLSPGSPSPPRTLLSRRSSSSTAGPVRATTLAFPCSPAQCTGCGDRTLPCRCGWVRLSLPSLSLSVRLSAHDIRPYLQSSASFGRASTRGMRAASSGSASAQSGRRCARACSLSLPSPLTLARGRTQWRTLPNALPVSASIVRPPSCSPIQALFERSTFGPLARAAHRYLHSFLPPHRPPPSWPRSFCS